MAVRCRRGSRATTTRAGSIRDAGRHCLPRPRREPLPGPRRRRRGRPVLKRRLARGEVLEFFATLPACLAGLEACAAAHYWARELTKLGHEVRLTPRYVRP